MRHQPRPLVAVIEMQAGARDALRALLRMLDVEVVTFASAEEYLGFEREPVCIIAGLELPGISGLDLLRRLRADRIRIPLILLADESDVPTAVTAMQAGASDFIEKPHADIAILRRVVQLLQQTSRRPDD
jgi:two-component system response regulator FixJ